VSQMHAQVSSASTKSKQKQNGIKVNL